MTRTLRRVYVCSRLRGSPERTMHDNILRARALCLAAAKSNVSPFAPHLFFTQFLDDSLPRDREMGIACGLAWLSEADEVWVDTKYAVSPGMRGEIEAAESLGVTVVVDPIEWKGVRP